MNRDELRKFFKHNGLCYADITIGDLRLLESLLNEEMAKQRTERILNNQPTYWIAVNKAKNYKGQYNDDETMICAYMTARGGYFNAREVISFNRDGFIGFCGEADNSNYEPVKNAFIRWCECLTKQKGA